MTDIVVTPPVPTVVKVKPWWKSKTIWAGIVTVVRGTYLVAQTQYHLPAIPLYVDAALSTLLGAATVHGRWTADSSIG